MKKIAILTLNGYFNYGNRLQNYALERFLIKLGYNVTTVKIKIDYSAKRSCISYLKGSIKTILFLKTCQSPAFQVDKFKYSAAALAKI